MRKDYAKNPSRGAYEDYVIEATDVLDMQELIAITDVAITDYSSWIYDFMLMRRPGFIFATESTRNWRILRERSYLADG